MFFLKKLESVSLKFIQQSPDICSDAAGVEESRTTNTISLHKALTRPICHQFY